MQHQTRSGFWFASIFFLVGVQFIWLRSKEYDGTSFIKSSTTETRIINNASSTATPQTNDSNTADDIMYLEENETKKIYYCAEFSAFSYYHTLLKLILPEYTWHHLGSGVDNFTAAANETDLWFQQQRDNRNEDLIQRPMISSHKLDIFLNHWEQPCHVEVYHWLFQFYAGKTLWVYPESLPRSRPLYRPQSFIELGPFKSHSHHVLLTFFQTVYYSLSPHQKDIIIGKYKRNIESSTINNATNTNETMESLYNRPYFLIYAHSNCIRFREVAFRRFGKVGDRLKQKYPTNSTAMTEPIYFGGSCQGNFVRPGMSLIKRLRAKNAIRFENSVGLDTFQSNIDVFAQFRFCLVLEHDVVSGYITEKLLLALVAQCIPIYHGPMEEVYDMIDKDFVIHYDPDNPQEALDYVQYLEENETAYRQHIDKVYSATFEYGVLAHGEETRRKYFSFTNEVGDGILKKRVRSLIGLRNE